MVFRARSAAAHRACREEALAKLKEDGFLLVQASMIDNMPYVLAEASVHGIPLIIYDVGGVTEMIDPKLHADVLVGTPKVSTALSCIVPGSSQPYGGSAGWQRALCAQRLQPELCREMGWRCGCGRFSRLATCRRPCSSRA